MHGAFDIAIAGAGASGLAAAVAAGRSGASVLLLEKGRRPGRSILASGNGRCNFANASPRPALYNDPMFVTPIMGGDGSLGLASALELFDGLGLWWTVDGEGRYYPRSRMAASVLDVLMGEIERLHVDVLPEHEVEGLEVQGGTIRLLCTGGAAFDAGVLIWAAGGGSTAVPRDAFGLKATATRPALCPLATDPAPPKALDGVRCPAGLTLLRSGDPVAAETGELLLRRYGVSGIAVFNLSRFARPGDELQVDLLPEITEDDLREMLRHRTHLLRGREPGLFLDGAIHPLLARDVMGRLQPASHADIDIDPLISLLKTRTVVVRGAADEDHAQVVRGGLANDRFDPSTLRSIVDPRLFACGEALDIDGPCGGYNLTWAWASGLRAGLCAARRTA